LGQARVDGLHEPGIEAYRADATVRVREVRITGSAFALAVVVAGVY
jgi:hypothetical protein